MARKTQKTRAKRKSVTHRQAADEHAATELVMFIENTSDLSPDGPHGQGHSVLLNALRKWKKGTYNPELAVRLFQYLADAGAKRYEKEFGSDAPIFNPATRHEAAKQLEASFRSSAEHGEYDHVDTRIGMHEMNARSPQHKQQRSGSFVVTLSTGQTARFHDMPRAQDWATQRLTGQPAGTYAAFYRAAVGPDRSDTGAPWTEPFYLLTVDEYGHVRVGDTRIVTPLPAQHPHRSLVRTRESRGLHITRDTLRGDRRR